MTFLDPTIERRVYLVHVIVGQGDVPCPSLLEYASTEPSSSSPSSLTSNPPRQYLTHHTTPNVSTAEAVGSVAQLHKTRLRQTKR
jgi:hypothetical protein